MFDKYMFSIYSISESNIDSARDIGDYIRSINAEIRWIDDDSQDSGVAGKIQAWRIHLGLNMDEENFSAFELFDGYSGEVYQFYDALFDADGEFREELDLDLGAGFDVLLLSSIWLYPNFRGFGLGRAVVLQVIRDFGFGCAMAIGKPYPLQFGGVYKKGTSEYRSIQFDLFSRDEFQAIRRLRSYWNGMGALPVPGYREFLYIDLSRKLVEMSDLMNGDCK